MNFQSFVDFAKVMMTEYDAIVTPEQDAEFRAKLAQFVTFVLNAVGMGIINYLITQITNLKNQISKLTAPKK